MGHVRRIIGFAAVPASTMISSLLILPILSSKFGGAGWSSVLLGQSIGAFVSVIAGLGWQVVGGNLVASADPTTRKAIFAESLKSRSMMLVLLLPVAAVLTYVLTPTNGLTTVLFMIGMALNCLNASWYFAGTAEPRMVLKNEALVRLGGYLVSIIVILISDELWTYAVVLIVVGCIMGLKNATSILGRGSSSAWPKTRKVWTVISSQFTGMLSRALQAGQLYIGNPVVAVLNPAALPLFTALDTIQKSVINASSVYPQSFAWWVGSVDGATRIRRIRLLSLTTILLGFFGFFCWVGFGQSIMHLLFAGRLDVNFDLNLVNGACMATLFVSKGLGLLGMVPLGLDRKYYVICSIGSVFSMAGLILGVLLWNVQVALLLVAMISLVQSAVFAISIYGNTRRATD